jgi:HrpA-like RNA helicase
VYSFRDRLIQTVGANHVTVVEGDTGRVVCSFA